MASGLSKRFNGTKLLAPFCGQTLGEYVIQRHAAELYLQTIVVTRYPQLALCAAMRGFTICENTYEDDIAISIALGVDALQKNIDGCMFLNCDQPLFSFESCKLLCNTFAENKDKIVAAAENGEARSPVIFPSSLFSALKNLPKNHGGKYVMNYNKQIIHLVNINSTQLRDIDTKEELIKLQSIALK